MKVCVIPLLLVVLAVSSAVVAAPRCDACPRDKHGRIERSSITKNEFKKANPCPATGRSAGACPGFVIDHIIALKRGGADSPANMQWQTTAEAKAKDKWE